MLQISEWLPNPKGTDTTTEWIELVNSGATPLSTSGYKLQAGKKVVAVPAHTLAAGEYMLLPRTQTKLSLRNTAEVLTLFSPAGIKIDESKIVGAAPEGKSFSRVGAAQFLFAEPTPGKPNAKPQTASLALTYPMGVPLHKPQAPYLPFVWALATGIGLAVAIMTIIVRNEALSNLVGERDNSDRAIAR